MFTFVGFLFWKISSSMLRKAEEEEEEEDEDEEEEEEELDSPKEVR